jgi:hypothetical protein
MSNDYFDDFLVQCSFLVIVQEHGVDGLIVGRLRDSDGICFA